MKPYKRTERVANLIKYELAELIRYKSAELKIPAITLTQIKLSSDFSYAKVFFSLLDEKEIKKTEKTLNGETKFFQNILAKKLDLRRTPKLKFFYDRDLEKIRKIDELLRERIEKL